MSTRTLTKVICDNCGKTVEREDTTFYVAPGWFEISLYVADKRDYISKDYCCHDCLVAGAIKDFKELSQMDEARVLRIAKEAHADLFAEKTRLGYHAPKDCTEDLVVTYGDSRRKCHYCLPELVAWEELDEKERDYFICLAKETIRTADRLAE